jgi:hypothetical protein
MCQQAEQSVVSGKMTGMDLAESVQNPTSDWPESWKAKVETLLKDWHEAGRAHFQRSYPNLDYDSDQTKTVTYKQRWAMLDEGGGHHRSGAFMLDRESGNIYRIKSAYGVPNYKKLIGHINNVTGRDLLVRRWNPKCNPDSPALYNVMKREGRYWVIDTYDVPLETASHIAEIINSRGRPGDPSYAKVVPARKRNPESTAAALSEDFHGRPAEMVTTLTEDMVERVDFMEAGDLVELKVQTPSGYDVLLQFPPKGKATVKLCASPDGKQLYFRGGDQTVPLDEIHMGAEKWRRDKMVLGELRETVYRAQKKFDGFKTYDYAHKNSEISKKYPVLIYDTLNDQLEVAGGTGFITWRGLED